ncbi:MAG TPA: tellurite resistance/C4-dicarboxylate transporter family protein [Acidimicrobiales bacterium]|nr:tellurite resistance/C4-dicarboxylate transporter family protein [Acidimicrobiales bacterium]
MIDETAGSVDRAPARAGFDPGWFACVMASGIISVGADLLGQSLLSDISLAVAAAAALVLIPGYVRATLHREEFRATVADPSRAMAYFTLVAGADVLGVRFAGAGHPQVAVVLGAAAAALWLVLSYLLPWHIVISARRPVLRDINGTWLIWVVATQSIAIVSAAISASAPTEGLRRALPAVAVSMWGVGVMLYIILIVIIFLRLLLVEITPAEMGPPYWIAMGATAISTRAATGILAIHSTGSGALVRQMRPMLVDLSVILWAFGTWWIPLLVLFGVWRHVLRRYPLTFEPRLWSVVFPLGMYTVASYTLGKEQGLGFMVDIARAWLWVGAAAWAATLGLMVAHGARSRTRR